MKMHCAYDAAQMRARAPEVDFRPDAMGQSLEEVFDTAMPHSLRRAKQYMTAYSWIIGPREPVRRPMSKLAYC